VAEAYRQMDVLVVPSLWIENSPLVIHEAFLAGVPVVGARIGGIEDLVTHDVTGLLYDPASTRALADALNRLIDDPQLLMRLSQNVRQSARVKSIADEALEWERVYDGLLTRADRRAPA
jgi:glycosyltransferase involved in cell wall biosynthesis